MFIDFVSSYRIYWRIEVKCRNFRVILRNKDWWRVVIDRNSNFSWSSIVKVRECDPVFWPDRMSHDNLIDVIKLIPIFIEVAEISEKRLEFRSTRYGYVKRFCSEKRFEIKKIVIIFINDIRKKLWGESMKISHGIQWEMPFSIWRAVDHLWMFERLMIIEPIEDRIIFILIEFHVNRFKRLHLENIFSIV